jgi:hypothetical protein
VGPPRIRPPQPSEARRQPVALPQEWSCGIIALAGICILILVSGLQPDAAKILKRKQVSQFQGFKVFKDFC